jgi:TrmH family RNA methyltransferase
MRQAERKFLLEGWRAVGEALSTPAVIELVVVQSRYLDDPDYRRFIREFETRKVDLREGTEQDLARIAETVHSQGIVAVVRQRQWSLDEILKKRPSLLVALDAVSDPGNMGTVLRSADWFGVDGVLLGKGCVELYNEKVVRSTVGSLVRIPAAEGIELPGAMERLRREGFRCIGTAAEAKDRVTDIDRSSRTVLVFGSEAHGLAQDLRAKMDQLVNIPRYGRAESLNVGVAAGIVLAFFRSNSST